MRKMKLKRYTALLLAFMLCLQLGAVSAFATDGENTESTAPAAAESTTVDKTPAAEQQTTDEQTAAEQAAPETVLTAPAASTYTPKDVTALLGSTVTVSQDGNTVKDGGTLDTAKNFLLSCGFTVPTAGDYYKEHGNTTGMDETKIVRDGDTATFAFDLPDSVSFANTTLPLTAQLDGKTVQIGTVSFDSGKKTVTVTFHSEDGVYDIPTDETDSDKIYYDLPISFDATMQFNGTKLVSGDKTTSFKLFDKTYSFDLTRTLNYTLKKSAVKNGSTITWTVTARAAYTDGGAAVLAGVKLTDDLTNAGAYQSDFAITKLDGKTVSMKPAADYDADGKVLTYTFPSAETKTESDPEAPALAAALTAEETAALAAASEATVTYTTKVDPAVLGAYFADGHSDMAFTNDAKLEKDGRSAEADAKVTYTMTKPAKSGKVTTSTGADVSYAKASDVDYSNFYITWTITVNQDGYTLTNASVTDKLPGGLTFVSASDGTHTWKEDPTDSKYLLGDEDHTITGPVTLTIVTKLDPTYKNNGLYAVTDDGKTTYYPTKQLSFGNTATLNWGTDGSVSSNTTWVNSWSGSGTQGYIGNHLIDKADGDNSAYRAATHTVNWKVTVNTQGYSYGGDLKVMDLITSGKTFYKNKVVEGLPDGITNEQIASLTVGYGMKYVADSLAGSPVTVAKYDLTDSKGNTAELLVFTGLSTAESNTFTYSTQLTNPDVYAANGGSVTNTASLFSNGSYVFGDWQKFSAPDTMLEKKALGCSASDALVDPLNTTDGSGAFNYVDKTACFSLFINKDNIDLSTDPNFAGTSFSVTDTLADDWSFAQIGDSKADFQLYTADGKPADSSLVTCSISGQTATFTFTKLPEQAYIIVVKAKLSDAGFKKLCTGAANSWSGTVNTAAVHDSAYTKSITGSASLTIPVTVLSKSYAKASDGVLSWTVDFNTFGLNVSGGAQNTLTLTDTLGEGTEFRTDKTGALLLTNNDKTANFTLIKRTLKADGSYADGEVCELTTAGTPGTDYILSYDSASRTLTLQLPSGSDSYCLSYLTDITGEAGESFSNSVQLSSDTWTPSVKTSEYTVQAVDVSASLQRGGWFRIVKRGTNNAVLSGAEFTLVPEGSSNIFRKGVTKADGTLSMKALPTGTYTLTETKAPDGYALAGESWTVIVGTDHTVTIDGRAVDSNSHEFTVYDVRTDSATLTITKKVAGNAADSKKAFGFTVTLPGSESDSYRCVGTGVDVDTMHGGDNAIELSAGESVTITNLPADKAYTVTEKDYSTDGYTASVALDGGTAETKNTVGGKTAAGKTDAVVFTNTRNVYYPVTPVTPSPSPSTPASPSPSTTPSEPTATVPDEPVPGGDKTVPSPSAPVTVPDDDVPTADKPVTPAGKTIPDGKTPTAATPKTGDSSALGLFGTLAGFSAAGLVCLLRGKRKNRSETRSR